MGDQKDAVPDGNETGADGPQSKSVPAPDVVAPTPPVVAATEKNCAECGKAIPASARICFVCGRHQRRGWQVVSALGLGALLAPVLSFLFSLGLEAKTALFWRDEVQVIAFYSEHSYTLRNTGSGPIFIAGIRYRHGDFEDRSMAINKTLQPGEFLAGDAAPKVNSAVIPNLTVNDHDGLAALKLPEGCLTSSFVLKDSSAIRTYREHLGDSLKTVPGKAGVTYFSKGTSQVVQVFDVEVFPALRRLPQCPPSVD